MTTPRPPPITATALPDVMAFTYNGKEYKIYLELGTHDEAYALAEEERWDVLSEWPAYEGQKHDYEAWNREHGTSYGKAEGS